MPYVFDTNALSVAMRKHRLARHPLFAEWLRTLPRSDQYTCATVVGELRFGARKSTQHTQLLLHRIDEVISHLTVLDYDLLAADRYSIIRADLFTRGLVIDEADMQIAACALQHNCAVVTANVKHFACVAGLQVHAVS